MPQLAVTNKDTIKKNFELYDPNEVKHWDFIDGDPDVWEAAFIQMANAGVPQDIINKAYNRIRVDSSAFSANPVALTLLGQFKLAVPPEEMTLDSVMEWISDAFGIISGESDFPHDVALETVETDSPENFAALGTMSLFEPGLDIKSIKTDDAELMADAGNLAYKCVNGKLPFTSDAASLINKMLSGEMSSLTTKERGIYTQAHPKSETAPVESKSSQKLPSSATGKQFEKLDWKTLDFGNPAEPEEKEELPKVQEMPKVAEEPSAAEIGKSEPVEKSLEDNEIIEPTETEDTPTELAEQARLAEEARKAEDIRKAAEAEKERLEEEARKAQEERLAAEAEKARLAEEARKAYDAEKARLAEDARKAAEAKAARLAVEVRKADEARQVAEAEKARLAGEAQKAKEVAPKAHEENRPIPDAIKKALGITQVIEKKPESKGVPPEVTPMKTDAEQKPEQDETPEPSRMPSGITARKVNIPQRVLAEIFAHAASREQVEDAVRMVEQDIADNTPNAQFLNRFVPGVTQDVVRDILSNRTPGGRYITRSTGKSGDSIPHTNLTGGTTYTSGTRTRQVGPVEVPPGFSQDNSSVMWDEPVITTMGYPFINYGAPEIYTILKGRDENKVKEAYRKLKKQLKKVGLDSPIKVLKDFRDSKGVQCALNRITVDADDLLEQGNANVIATVYPRATSSLQAPIGNVPLTRDFIVEMYRVLSPIRGARIYMDTLGMTEDEYADTLNREGHPPVYIFIPKEKLGFRKAPAGFIARLFTGNNKPTLVEAKIGTHSGGFVMPFRTTRLLFTEI